MAFSTLKPTALSHSTTTTYTFTSLIVDLGDVLFTWTLNPKSFQHISPKTLKRMMVSPVWADYQCGRISQQECYEQLGVRFSTDASEIAHVLAEARTTLRFESRFLAYIRSLKEQHHLRVFAMSNVSHEDYEYLRKLDVGWDAFDEIFSSFSASVQKPDLAFYQKVIAKTGVDPSKTIFLDDKLDNVVSARSLGMHGIVFCNVDQSMQAITNLVSDPVERAWRFLRQHAGHLESVTSNGISLYENFAQYLIFEVTGDRSLITTTERLGVINFFRDYGHDLPADLDMTAIGWTAEKADDHNAVHSVMDEMLHYITDDGIIQVYFDRERPRIDPVACCNVLTLFHTYGRGSELHSTLTWVTSVLVNRAYLDGTRYYKSADAFLYFFARFLSRAEGDIHRRYAGVLAERLRERVGSPGDELELAMRVVASASVDVRDNVDVERLIERQGLDGSWEEGWCYRYGMTGIFIGCKGMTTAYAMHAIELAKAMEGNIKASVPVFFPYQS